MSSIDRFSENVSNLKRKYNDFTDPNIPAHYPPDLEIEPIHLDIDLYIDIANKSLAGTVTTTVRSRRDGPATLTLDAVDFLDLDVKDPDDREIQWQYDGEKLEVTWASPFAEAEKRQVAVAYRIVEPIDGLIFLKPDESYPNQPWLAVTDHETERAQHWLPCVDLPNVRTTLDFHLRAESRFTILANGLLLKEIDHGNGTKTAHWRLDQVCPSYLVCFAIGEFIRASDGFFEDSEKRIELAYFTTDNYDANTLMRTFDRTGSIMAWMTDKLQMPFPFPKYYQFAVPGLGGAMENISLTSWDEHYLLDEELAKERALSVDTTNVHEMAHSYFGDAVVIRDFAHAWLKESWATYMEQVWCAETRNQDEADFVYYDDATGYFKEADERYQRPIVSRRYRTSWQMYDRHLYPGGACRLHTLHMELGDKTFWAGVRDYLTQYKGKVVETDDFRRIMEAHSGRSLGAFFDQWFHSPGYPDLEVSFKYDAEEKIGIFEIKQKQVDKDKGIPAFQFSTDLGWVIDGEERRMPVKIKESSHTFVVAMATKPEQVRFDPSNKVLHKLSFNPGSTLLKNQLTQAPDMIGRVLAAKELAKTAKRANIQAIVDAYKKEAFWGTRQKFALILGEANTEATIEGLVELINFEQDPMVMAELFEAAGNFRDNRIRDAIGQRLMGNLPPFARSKAYQAMGAQRKQASWDLLLEGSRQTGIHGIAQSGAFSGLAATRRDEAVDLLLEAVPYGVHSNEVRPTITSALGDIGQGLEKAKREEVLEFLSDLLRDPWRRVRVRAAFALSTMQATEAIDALESFKQSQSKQSQTYVDELIQSLRSTDKSDGSALKKQVEELQEKVRELEDQIQKLEAKVKVGETT